MLLLFLNAIILIKESRYDMKYKRVLLKLSGESLKGEKDSGVDFQKVLFYANQIKTCVDNGVQIGIVIGGGNFWRGRSNTMMNSCTSDDIGMLATAMNALALKDALLQCGTQAIVLSSIEMNKIAKFYTRDSAIKYLEKGKVVIFSCGTGNPFFSTDTAASLRALEINADVILKSTNVDGVYTSDPNKDPNATKIEQLTYRDILTKNLNVIDDTAASLCNGNQIPMIIFNGNIENNIKKVIEGEKIGTIIQTR